MNYLELVRGLRGRVGMQGSGPSSVDSATGAEQDLVNCVRDAWIDIQNYERPTKKATWKWMRARQTFSTTALTNTYELSDIFVGTYRFRKWLPHTAYISVSGTYKPMSYYPDSDYFRYLTINQSTGSVPYRFSSRASDYAILIDMPDDAYTIVIDYQKSPQLLSSNTDTPEMPEEFHNLILYKAIEKYSVIAGDPEMYQHYSKDYAEQWGNLCRNQLESAKILIRGIA